MLLKVPLIMVHMILPIKPLPLLWYLPQPAHSLSQRIHLIELRPFLLQLLRDRIDVEVQVLAQELADFSVLVVTTESGCGFRIRRVDIDIGG
jgi:hypothetical protein